MSLFQFDYDQTWCVVFLNADRTIYGRYGTRAAGRTKSDSHISVVGFKKAMQRALATHKKYPLNKALLSAYSGDRAEFATPEEIPTMRKNNCIHCHQVHDSLLRHKWEQQKLKSTDLFVYPLPERIGLQMDPQDCLVVKRLRNDSPAEKAGLRVGDRIVRINGLPLLSQADIQWVLHRSPSDTQLNVAFERDGRKMKSTVALMGDWKVADLSWRESSWRALRHAVRLEPLSIERKARIRIAPEAMAFEVKNMYGKGPQPLRNAGLKVGDVILGINGRTDLVTETAFLVHLRLTYGPKDTFKLKVLRSGKRFDLELPTW